MKLSWTIKPFAEISVQEWHDLLRLRVDVFVVEQNCPYAELDGLDPTAMHVFATDEKGDIVAYARVLPPDAHGLPHIGRVVGRKDLRGLGIATEAMQHALEVVKRLFGSYRSALAAQTHLEVFYAKFGFLRTGEDYMWDGIPHVDMMREAE